MNLLDDSPVGRPGRDPAAASTTAMHERFQDLAAYAVGNGAEAILFTCSAFGPCIDAVARRYPQIPVLKPNEAMIADAAGAAAGPVGLIATFGPTLASMPPEFPARVALRFALAEGALDALNRGDVARHDALIAEQATATGGHGCDDDRPGAIQHGARARACVRTGQRQAGADDRAQRRAWN